MGRFFRSFKGHGRNIAKLGIYAAICLGVLMWLVSLIGNIGFFDSRKTYSAELADVTGLFVNDAVKIAGIEVGAVKGIEVERGRAIVKFEVDDEVELLTQSEVGIRWRNILGQKYLYLYPGTKGEPLEEGDKLPLSQSVDSAEVGEFLNAIGPFLQAIDPKDVNAFNQAILEALQGNDEKVRRLIDNTATVSGTLGSVDTEVGRSIENLDQVLTALAERDEALDSTVTNLSALSDTLAERNEILNDAVVQFAAVQEQLRILLDENRGDIDQTIVNLEAVSEVLRTHRDELDTSLRTLPDGLAGYHLISRYGQWFNVRAIVNCAAAQSFCDHPQPSEGGGSGGAGGASGANSLGDIFRAPLTGATR